MLRKIRLTLDVLCFATVTLLFLDFTGTLHTWLGWTAKIQFLPALLALNVGIVGFFVLVTLVFGRVYCSVICPLGVMQDIIAWMGKKQKKNRYCYSPAKSWLRYGVLAVFVVAMIAGIGSLVACGKTYYFVLLIENKGLTKIVSLTGNDLETSGLLYSAMFCINQKNAFLICKNNVFLPYNQSYSSEK